MAGDLLYMRNETRRSRQSQLAWVSWIDDGGVGLAGLRVAVRTLRWCRERLLARSGRCISWKAIL